MPASQTHQKTGICVTNAQKTYKGLDHPVLNGLDMTVEQGSIYGLLGPSGCGKTTLLKCIIGCYSLDSGFVEVFGHKTPVASKELRIPGKDIGYTPQELALYLDFRINELFYFYGVLNGMKSEHIFKQMDFIQELLHLPDGNRLIKTLSGGQKRLVSFGTAVIHDPRLMILDEPTVGVDPVISASIWQHLVYLSTNRGTTIIITTHYIEEARQANRVGLMRAGKLLCEGEPESLVKQSSAKNLEEVFLTICQREDDAIDFKGENKHSKPGLENSFNESGYSKNDKTSSAVEPISTFDWLSLTLIHLYACVFKELILILRDVPSLVLMFFLPFLQLIVFLFAIGGNPIGLQIAVVNEDHTSYNSSLSVQFIHHLGHGDWSKLKHYRTLEQAKKSADHEEIAAIVHFMPNFTESFITKTRNCDDFDAQRAENSFIYLTQDEGSPLNADFIWLKAELAYMKLEKYVYDQISPNTSIGSFGIRKTEPLFRHVNSFRIYEAPRSIIYLTFTMAIMFASLRIVGERKQGLVERLSISGVTGLVLTLCVVIVQSFILLMEVAVYLMTVLVIFSTPLEGNLTLVIALATLQGLSGLVLGVLISVVSNEESQVVQTATGSTSILMLLSGIMWPLESMPPSVRSVINFLPMSAPAKAMRCIFLRGWDTSYDDVQDGFLVNFAYFFGLLALTLILQNALHRKG